MKIYCILFDACPRHSKIEEKFKSKNIHYGDLITNSWTGTSLLSLFTGITPSELYPTGIGYENPYRYILTKDQQKEWNSKILINQLPKDWNIHIHAIPETRGDTSTFRFVPDEIFGVNSRYNYYNYKTHNEVEFLKQMQHLPSEKNHFIFIKYNHYHDAIKASKEIRPEPINNFTRIIDSINFKEKNSLFWLFSDHGNWHNIDKYMTPPDSWLSWVSITDNIRSKIINKKLFLISDFYDTVTNIIHTKSLPNDVTFEFDPNRIYVVEDGRSNINERKSTSVSCIKYLEEDLIHQLVYHSPTKEIKEIIYNIKNKSINSTSPNPELLKHLKNGIWSWYFK